ncbi:MAG TPA: hypothetical protein VGF85_01185 [Opitutaceae bacterium]|jgi:hypothetical protein
MTPPDDEGTGLPGLRTWRGIYVLVVVVFAAWVAVLTLLDWVFP